MNPPVNGFGMLEQEVGNVIFFVKTFQGAQLLVGWNFLVSGRSFPCRSIRTIPEESPEFCEVPSK